MDIINNCAKRENVTKSDEVEEQLSPTNEYTIISTGSVVEDTDSTPLGDIESFEEELLCDGANNMATKALQEMTPEEWKEILYSGQHQ